MIALSLSHREMSSLVFSRLTDLCKAAAELKPTQALEQMSRLLELMEKCARTAEHKRASETSAEPTAKVDLDLNELRSLIGQRLSELRKCYFANGPAVSCQRLERIIVFQREFVKVSKASAAGKGGA